MLILELKERAMHLPLPTRLLLQGMAHVLGVAHTLIDTATLQLNKSTLKMFLKGVTKCR